MRTRTYSSPAVVATSRRRARASASVAREALQRGARREVDLLDVVAPARLEVARPRQVPGRVLVLANGGEQ
ncbi:hypothetical protein ABGT92_01435 [Streptomyces cinereoruber]|uniref:hypothetical protein n=1 Tax=Streptomyces cinereoruber TaxID=67260 RepID=UPI00345DB365